MGRAYNDRLRWRPVEHYDIAVIGLGGIGSATAWFAARGGRSVIGLERFALGGHHHGASHDHSRIIRHSYHTEHYVHLTRFAYDAWRQVEAESGETCVHTTGGIDLFPRDAAIDIDTYRESMRATGVPFDELTGTETMARWPAWHLPADTEVLYQANTGIVSPAATVPLLQRLASDRGADLRGDCTVVAIEPDGEQVDVRLADGTDCRCHPGGRRRRRVDGAAGRTARCCRCRWSSRRSRSPTTTPSTRPSSTAPCLPGVDLDGRPVVLRLPDLRPYRREDRPGLRRLAGRSRHPRLRARPGDPGAHRRLCSRGLRRAARRAPCRRPRASTRCTPDRDFVVDSLPDHPNVHVALGAGHGYKFVAWFGRTLAALATDENPGCDLTPFRLARPALTDPSWEANWLV